MTEFSPPSETQPPIRLAFGFVFWRLMLYLTAMVGIAVALAIHRRVPLPQAVAVFIWWIPSILALAFSWAALGTVLLALIVRLFIAPRMRRWQSPRIDESTTQFAFHLEPHERECESSPCRLLDGGRLGSPGRLVLTDRRLLFLPNDWRGESWSARLVRLDHAACAPGRAMMGRMIKGVPASLEVVFLGEAPRRFAVVGARRWATALTPAHRGIVFHP